MAAAYFTSLINFYIRSVIPFSNKLSLLQSDLTHTTLIVYTHGRRLSTPMGVDNLRVYHCSGSTLCGEAMDWSNAIFHGLLKVITKYKLLQKAWSRLSTHVC